MHCNDSRRPEAQTPAASGRLRWLPTKQANPTAARANRFRASTALRSPCEATNPHPPTHGPPRVACESASGDQETETVRTADQGAPFVYLGAAKPPRAPPVMTLCRIGNIDVTFEKLARNASTKGLVGHATQQEDLGQGEQALPSRGFC